MAIGSDNNGGGGGGGGDGNDDDDDDGENNFGELVEFLNVLLFYLSGTVKCRIIIYKHYVQRKPWLDNKPRRRGQSDTNIRPAAVPFPHIGTFPPTVVIFGRYLP